MVVHGGGKEKADDKCMVVNDTIGQDLSKGSRSKCPIVTSLMFNIVMLCMLFGAGFYLCRYRRELCDLRVQHDVMEFEALGIEYEVKGCKVHALHSEENASTAQHQGHSEIADMDEHHDKHPGYRQITLFKHIRNRIRHRHKENITAAQEEGKLEISQMTKQHDRRPKYGRRPSRDHDTPPKHSHHKDEDVVVPQGEHSEMAEADDREDKRPTPSRGSKGPQHHRHHRNKGRGEKSTQAKPMVQNRKN